MYELRKKDKLATRVTHRRGLWPRLMKWQIDSLHTTLGAPVLFRLELRIVREPEASGSGVSRSGARRRCVTKPWQQPGCMAGGCRVHGRRLRCIDEQVLFLRLTFSAIQ